MLAKHIQSLQHPIVKKMYKLRKDKEFRYLEREVFVLGKKMVNELSKKITPHIFFTYDKNWATYPSCPSYLITPQIMQKISGVKNPEEVAAVFPLPSPTDLTGMSSFLVLDHIKDPGNMGTLFRTALGLGFEGIILLENCVDPFNDKALRSAKGASFFLPYSTMNKKSYIAWAIKRNISSYIADIRGKDPGSISYKPPLSLILSNESEGVSDWPKEFLSVAITMEKSVESLNVAISGAILMYVMKNG